MPKSLRIVLKANALLCVLASIFAQFAISAAAALPFAYLTAFCLLLLVNESGAAHGR